MSAIRAALWSDRGNMASELGPEIGADIAFTDDGDLPLTENTAHDDAAIRRHVAMLHEDGEVPLALGGDHAVSFPLVEAAATCFGPVHILHFDAHPDLYDDFSGNPRSHASPFARICEAGHAARLVQVGIRTLNGHCREQAARFGVEIIPMAAARIARQFAAKGGSASLRMKDGAPLVTDNGLQLLDVKGLVIADPLAFESEVNQWPGVVTVGVFAHQKAQICLLATPEGVRTIEF